jgi:hypothetical protein
MSNKKVLSQATRGLNKAKAPSKPRDIIYDPMGYWNPNNQGQPVRIPGNGKGTNITMGPNPETGTPIPYPVWAQPNVGQPQMMYPGQDYNFPEADYVDEYPQMKKGGLKKNKTSRNLMATNKLFAKHAFFKKPGKNVIFDPNSPNYQDGGFIIELDDDEIQAYKDGGYVVEDISIPTLNQMDKGGSAGCPPGHYYNGKSCVKIPKGAKVITDPKEYEERDGAYKDSSNLYKAYQMQDKLMGPGNYKTKDTYKWNTAQLKEDRKKRIVKGLEDYGPIAQDFQSEADQFKDGYNAWTARKEDKQLLDYYKKLGFKPNQIMYHSSPDLVSDKIKAIGSYFDGNAISPIYKKPVQPVVLDKEYNEPIVIPVPPGKIQVGTKEIQSLDPKTGRVKTVIEPVYEDNPMPEKLPLLPPQLIDTSRAELQGEYQEEPELVPPNWGQHEPWTYRLPVKPKYRGKLQNPSRYNPAAAMTQYFSGYEPLNEEEYVDVEGRIVPKGFTSLQDIGVQKRYNKAYDEYEAKQQEYETKQQFAKAMAAGYGLKQDGGESNDMELTLTPKEIEWYKSQGYTIEEL